MYIDNYDKYDKIVLAFSPNSSYFAWKWGGRSCGWRDNRGCTKRKWFSVCTPLQLGICKITSLCVCVCLRMCLCLCACVCFCTFVVLIFSFSRPVYGLNVLCMLKHETLVLTESAVNELTKKLIFAMNRSGKIFFLFFIILVYILILICILILALIHSYSYSPS